MRWYDTRAVTMVSTYVGPEPVDKVKRWDRSRKEFIEVQRPLIVSEYNQSMCGVDLLDSLLAKYRYPMKSKRWFMYIFWVTLKIGVSNAWLSYRQDCKLLGVPAKQVMNPRKFQAHVASSLPYVNVGAKRTHGTPSPCQKCKVPAPRRISKGPTIDVQKDELAHWPIKVEKRGRCKLCKENNTDTLCEKCEIRLCFTEKRDCFRQCHVA